MELWQLKLEDGIQVGTLDAEQAFATGTRGNPCFASTVRDLPIPICEWVRYDGSVILRNGPFCESLPLHLPSLEVTQNFFFKLSVPDLLREEERKIESGKMESGGRWGAHAFSNCDSIELRELASRALKSALSLCVLRARPLLSFVSATFFASPSSQSTVTQSPCLGLWWSCPI